MSTPIMVRPTIKGLPGFNSVRHFRVTRLQREVMPATPILDNPLSPSSTVGVDLLPLMANPSFSAGTTGFTPPLAAGTYTFLIQQGNPVTTGYRFNMTVRSVSVPEPGSSLCLLGMGGLAILVLRRRLGYLDRRIR